MEEFRIGKRKCIVLTCEGNVYCKSLCKKCYHRKWRKGLCNSHAYRKENAMPCVIEDCAVVVWAKRLCKRHYNQVWRHGAITHKYKGTALFTINRRVEEIGSVTRELKRALGAYENASNLKTRMFWRNEIRILEKAMGERDAKEENENDRSVKQA